MDYRPTWNLRTIPDAVFYSEVARRRVSRRGDRVGGRPRILQPCPTCSAEFSGREMLKHTRHCPKRPAQK